VAPTDLSLPIRIQTDTDISVSLPLPSSARHNKVVYDFRGTFLACPPCAQIVLVFGDTTIALCETISGGMRRT
jgi:hypothetical protein